MAKKLERVYREISHQSLEKKNNRLTQKGIAKECKLAISTVNYAIKPLEEMGAISKLGKGFKVIDIKKVLLYWANNRNLSKDIIYKTFYPDLSEAEKLMPSGAVFTAYTAYKIRFRSAPADYSGIYVYAKDLQEIKKRFPASKRNPNVFILKLDPLIKKTSKNNSACLGQIFADLWNLKEWYASDFIKEFEERLSL